MDCNDALRRIPPAPASARTVLCALAEQGPLTMKDLQQVSGLARRTIYGAIQRLRSFGVLVERPNLHDTRQTFYWVSVPGAA